MSTSWFKDANQRSGKPANRTGQLKAQKAVDLQNTRRMGQQGYSTLGIKPRKK